MSVERNPLSSLNSIVEHFITLVSIYSRIHLYISLVLDKKVHLTLYLVL